MKDALKIRKTRRDHQFLSCADGDIERTTHMLDGASLPSVALELDDPDLTLTDALSSLRPALDHPFVPDRERDEVRSVL